MWKTFRKPAIDSSIGEIDRRRLATDCAEALSAVRGELDTVLIGQLPKGTEIAKGAKSINGVDGCSPF
jgi:hypothetical protein